MKVRFVPTVKLRIPGTDKILICNVSQANDWKRKGYTEVVGEKLSPDKSGGVLKSSVKRVIKGPVNTLKPVTPDEEGEDDDGEYSSWTVKELKAKLDELEVEYDSKANKTTLIELLEEAGEDEG